MPTYEYICTKCDEQFEVFQSIADKPLTVCPKDKCRRKTWGKGKVKKLISAGAGLLFKGSGFYITDYRSEGYKKAASQEAASSKPADGDGGKSKSSGSDSKPASGKADSSSSSASTQKPAATSKSS